MTGFIIVFLYTDSTNIERMDNKVVSVKGILSPEYHTILKNSGDLESILGLPINKSDASVKLAEAQLISPGGNVSGKDMINSVLSDVKFKAMNFYKFLAVLQNLSETEEIFPRLHQTFYGRLISR